MAKWFVTDKENNVVSSTQGTSKQQARDKFTEKMKEVRDEFKPWDFWVKKGFKLRRK